MKVLEIILLILFLIFLLTLFSVKLSFRYKEKKLSLTLGILFLKFQLLPVKEQKEKHRKKTKKEIAEFKKEKEIQQTKNIKTDTLSKATIKDKPQKREKQDTKEIITIILDMIKSAAGPVRFFLRHLKIRNTFLQVIVGGEEPDETAVRFGHWNAAIYSGMAVLQNWADIQIRKINIAVDFTELETILEAEGTVKVRIIVALIAVLRIIFRILAHTLKRVNPQHVQAAAANEM